MGLASLSCCGTDPDFESDLRARQNFRSTQLYADKFLDGASEGYIDELGAGDFAKALIDYKDLGDGKKVMYLFFGQSDNLCDELKVEGPIFSKLASETIWHVQSSFKTDREGMPTVRCTQEAFSRLLSGGEPAASQGAVLIRPRLDASGQPQMPALYGSLRTHVKFGASHEAGKIYQGSWNPEPISDLPDIDKRVRARGLLQAGFAGQEPNTLQLRFTPKRCQGLVDRLSEPGAIDALPWRRGLPSASEE